ncbi:MAG: hypothetical protein Q8R98_09500 [Rubrivivax sp.]|nr:hypothetical protein [Rubrivivax sp.]MDP3223952.1 hypothetical protein [Rubrivivax sp.]MDP3612074.1 hypothetical protein [Rubrivivax sp.]
MKTTNLLICALALTTLAWTGAQAQNTRAEVKAETRAGAASQAKGELSTPNQDKGSAPKPSVESRDAVKSEAKAARKDGKLVDGQRSPANQAKGPAPRMPSDTTRAAVKAEAAASGGATSQGDRTKLDMSKGVTKP